MSPRAPDAAKRAIAAERAAAKAEMRRSLSSTVDAAASVVDPLAWVKRYPLASLSAAAVAGFLAASATPRLGVKAAEAPRPNGEPPHRHRRFTRVATVVTLGLVRSVWRFFTASLAAGRHEEPSESVAAPPDAGAHSPDAL